MTNQQSHNFGYGDYVRFRDLVLARSGLYFSEKKRSDLEFGLLKAMQNAPLETRGNIHAYFQYLNNAYTPEAQTEMERLLNLLTIGETHFFRNEAQFDALATEVLPSLIARKREVAAVFGMLPTLPQLRIWSAGCATGEEAYSLAILLQELITDIERWNILILATDINQDSLARAREALYSNWSFREPRALALQSLYFKRQASRFKLRDDIRKMVTFSRHNLIEDPFPSLHNNTAAMDLILCRNVTIYFTEETTRYIVQGFYESLAPGGWFVVGHSEPSLTIYRAFQISNFPGAPLYQKRVDSAGDFENLQAPDHNGALPRDAKGTFTEATVLNTTPSARPPIVKAPAGQPESETSPQYDQPAPGSGDGGEVVQQLAKPTQLNEEMALLIEENQAEVPEPLRAPAYCQLARFYAGSGRWQTAQRWCQEAISHDNLCAEAYFLLSLVYEHQGRLEAAVDELRKVIYINAEEPLAHFYLAMLHRRLGHSGRAQRAFSNAIRILSRWPPEKVVPDSNERSAQELADVCRRLLQGLEAGDQA
jgi:chemotaxis protein methyltransferase CheR